MAGIFYYFFLCLFFFLITLSPLSYLTQFFQWSQTPLELNYYPCRSLFTRKKVGRLAVTTSMKRRSTTFHVAVVPWRQRNIPTSVTHVNLCLFKPLFLWRSRCYPCYGNSNEPIRFQTKPCSGQPAWSAAKQLGVNNDFYYISESKSGQGKANPTFWLATRAGSSGFPALVPQVKAHFLAI